MRQAERFERAGDDESAALAYRQALAHGAGRAVGERLRVVEERAIARTARRLARAGRTSLDPFATDAQQTALPGRGRQRVRTGRSDSRAPIVTERAVEAGARRSAEADVEEPRLRLARHFGFVKTRSGLPTYVIAGELESGGSLTDVTVSIRYLDRDGAVIHARTLQIPSLQPGFGFPFEDRLYDAGLAAKVADYEIVVVYRGRAASRFQRVSSRGLDLH